MTPCVSLDNHDIASFILYLMLSPSVSCLLKDTWIAFCDDSKDSKDHADALVRNFIFVNYSI
jgi:hypothetical protein